MPPSNDVTLPKRSVLGSNLAYREIGGPPQAPVALFLHGNPTSSYIWRNIMPLVAPVAHCIAPDLIGFGQSDKPDIEYRFFDHVRYLDAFIDASGIRSAFLVAQDWGSGLAFELAARRPELIQGLAFMEFIRPWPNWAEFTAAPEIQQLFQAFRTPGDGEKLVLDDNVFVEKLLPGAVARGLTADEMAVYRAPFASRAARRPVLSFPRDLPIAGDPRDVHFVITEVHNALASASYPKLLFCGKPGAIVTPEFAGRFAASLRNCRVVQLESGIHYLQEDHPETIGHSLREWIAECVGKQ
jgi:haloalkane dehalogenase